MRMDLVIRVGLVIVLLGIGRVRAEYSDVEKALIANRLLSLLQGQREMIQRQSNHQLDVEESKKDSVRWDNSLNRPLKVECNIEKGEAIVKIRSKFSKKDGDRQFKWECQDVTEGAVPLTDCEWSKEVNKWNGPISYVCPADQVMAGVKSKNHESKDDRKWKVKCCKAHGHITKSCRISERLNSYRGDINYVASHSGAEPYVFVGIQSLENPKNDREWQVFECKFGTPKCPQYYPHQFQQNPTYPPQEDPHTYDIVLDVNKPPPPPLPQPERHTYTLHAEPVSNENHYTIDLSPESARGILNKQQQRAFTVQENENANRNVRNKNGPRKLLPVPPGTKKHPDPPPRSTTSPPPIWQPRPPSAGHVIEIVPHSSTPRNEFRTQAPERHVHIYPPPGNIPGHFTVIPNTPNAGGPKIHYTEPPRPPKKMHYHLQLPPRQKPNPPQEVHYNMPLPTSDSGNGVKIRVPLPQGSIKHAGTNINERAISLLRELAKGLLNSEEKN